MEYTENYSDFKSFFLLAKRISGVKKKREDWTKETQRKTIRLYLSLVVKSTILKYTKTCEILKIAFRTIILTVVIDSQVFKYFFVRLLAISSKLFYPPTTDIRVPTYFTQIRLRHENRAFILISRE